MPEGPHAGTAHSQTWDGCVVSFRGAEASCSVCIGFTESGGVVEIDDLTEDSVETKGPQHFEGVMYARS